MTDQPAHLGLGLRPHSYREMLETSLAVDWLEVLSENYIVPGGQPGPVTTVIESDSNILPLAELITELDRARSIAAVVHGKLAA